MNRKCSFIFCILISIFSVYCDNSYSKSSNSYVRSDGNASIPAPAPGYVEIATSLLQDFKAGKIQVEALNKFNTGLEQYFILKIYERDDMAEAPKVSSIPLQFKEPISLLSNPNEGTVPIISENAYGYPMLRYNARLDSVYDALGTVSQFKFSLSSKSDLVIITGSFIVNSYVYFYVYNMKQVVHSISLHAVRGKFMSDRVAIDSLQFASEEFLHTYDSSFENYTQINEILTNEVMNRIRINHLPYLQKLCSEKCARAFFEKDLKFIRMYQKLILSALAESAIQYISAKNLSSFEVKPLNFTSGSGSRVFVQSYKDIKLDGLLNFVKYELVNFSMEFVGESNDTAKISEGIQLDYADEGEKQAFISFLISDGRRENSKKFKVKCITIIAVYNSKLTERPLRAFRNKEVFFNNSGFLIKFELDDFDPIYEFLIRHIGNDMARAIEETMLAEPA